MEIAINALLDPAPYNLVRQLQTEIAQHFPTEATLKLEPHITVKYAFPISDLSDVTNYFYQLAKSTSAIPFTITGIETFPTKVIFLNIAPNNSLSNLHMRLLKETKKQFGASAAEFEGNDLHFHITLAYKDITNEAFPKIKDFLAKRSVNYSGTLTKLGLYLRLTPDRPWFVYQTAKLSE